MGRNKSRSEVDDIWSKFIDSAEINLKSGISSEEYNLGMKTLGKLMKKEWSSVQEKMQINEGRAGIGRFSGPSKFTKKAALHVLRALVDETNNEGKASFDIDFSENSSVDLVLFP